MRILLLLALVLIVPIGCTQAQIDRAAQISAAADARLAEADQAMALAQAAIDQGKALAEQVGSLRAEQVVTQAQQALAAAVAAREVAKVAADAGHAALTAAKDAQAAGSSSIDVLLAAITAFLPTAGVALVAIRKAIAAAQAFRQTVAGVEAAKETMPPDQVDKLHAALAAEQDDAVKQRVSLVKATLAALFLCIGLAGAGGASELGLGPSPVAGSASVDSAAITDGAIVNADVNASAAIAGTKVAPAFGAQNISSTNTGAASFTTTGGYTSTVATGTAPFTSTSTTVCPNLNAALLNGTTWTAPGAIGGVTPAAGSFTSVTSSALTSGRVPFSTTNGLLTDNGNLQYASTTGVSAIGSTKGGVFTTTDSGTSNITDTLNSYHRTSGTPLAGFAAVINIGADSSTNSLRNIMTVRGEWIDPTDASRTGRVSFFTYDTSAREFMRADASGSVAKLGFFGATAVVKPAATDDLRTALINLGLYTTGGASPLDLNGGALTTAAATHSGVTSVTDTTDATTATAASLKTLGGIGATKNILGKQGLGWGVTSVVTAAGTTVITTSSTAVQVFTGSTTQTVTLPAANAFGAGIGYVLFIKNVSSGTVTVNRAGSDTINDASSVTTKAVATFTALRLVSDGVSAWEVL